MSVPEKGLEERLQQELDLTKTRFIAERPLLDSWNDFVNLHGQLFADNRTYTAQAVGLLHDNAHTGRCLPDARRSGKPQYYRDCPCRSTACGTACA